MFKEVLLIAAIALLYSSSILAQNGFGINPDISEHPFKHYYKNLNRLDLEIAGTGYGHIRTDLPEQEGNEGWCFGGVPMYDRKSNLLVGHATHCLTNTEYFTGPLPDTSSIIVDPSITFLDFFSPNGGVYTLTAFTRLTIHPRMSEMTPAWGQGMTHLAEGSRLDDPQNNTCLVGSGPFDGARCVSRISGALNMGDMDPENIPNSLLHFSYFFSVEGIQLQDWAVDLAAGEL